ncbi:hypothetical protein BKA62DRAFT_328883 [Auriculariales sp. MPI-PUGE-AT-0066]|nr:hypothetical protein BKA62DRAFT_328883 [Auriculariales sp. MPI-PUGE-AT-0066]
MDILPDELCQEIFACLAGVNQQFDFLQPNLPAFSAAVRTPFHIAATCTRWQALVFSSPELWAFAYARDDRITDDVYLRTCIERSGHHPLDVWIHSDVSHWQISPEGDDDDADDGEEANRSLLFFEWLDLLERNANRWRRIRIDFPRPTSIGKFGVFTKPMPFLEQLALLTPSTELGERMVSTANQWQPYFRTCPILRSLTSHATVMVPAATLSKLEYLNLNLRGISDDTPLWDTLAMTPDLKELTIYFDRWREYSSEPPSTPRHLPALRSLGLLGYFQYEQNLGEYLSVPNLDTLTVSVDPCDRLQTTFTSIGRTVDHIVISAIERRGYFARSDAEALDSLQHITTLELYGIPPTGLLGDTDDFFASLAGIGGYSEDPMPKWGRTLNKIILRDCTVDLGRCGSLASLLGMRTTNMRNNVSDVFELQLINTKFIKRMNGQLPESLSSVMHLFEPAIVEVEPEDTSESETSGDEQDGGVHETTVDDTFQPDGLDAAVLETETIERSDQAGGGTSGHQQVR